MWIPDVGSSSTRPSSIKTSKALLITVRRIRAVDADTSAPPPSGAQSARLMPRGSCTDRAVAEANLHIDLQTWR
jgi:hypothetical protein